MGKSSEISKKVLLLLVLLGAVAAGTATGGDELPGDELPGDELPGDDREAARSPSSEDSTFQIPFGRIRRFGRYEPDDVLPAPLADFRRRRGTDGGGGGNSGWEISWNTTHGTPHLVVPTRPHALVPGALLAAGDDAGLASLVRDFLEEERDFFGVDAEQLEAPVVYGVGRHRVAVFRQRTPSGLPVRGAGLRVVVRADGTLGWIKAFLVRDVRDPESALLHGLLDEASVRAVAEDWFHEVGEAELQVGFESDDPASRHVLWRLEVVDEDGWGGSALFDASSGELLARARSASYFEGEGAGGPAARTLVFGYTGDPEARSGFSSLFLRGALLREGTAAVGASGEQGVAVVPVSSDEPTLTVSLESRVCPAESPPRECFPQPLDAEGFRREFAVMPRERFGPLIIDDPPPLPPPPVPPELLPAELDSDGDGVPDLVVSGSTALPFVFEFNPPLAVVDDTMRRERGFWVTAFREGFLPVALAREALGELDLAVDLVQRIGCVVVAPLPLAEHPDGFLAQGAWAPMRPCTGIFITRMLRSRLSGELEPTAGSMVAHEAAHHVVRQLAGIATAVSPRFRSLEEGVVDALAAMARGSGRIGYLGRLETIPRSDAIDLDSEDDAFRRQARRQVAKAFFTLHRQTREDGRAPLEALTPGTPSAASKLLLLWLAFHRLVEMRDGLRFFGPAQHIFEELLLIDDLPELGGDGILENGTPHGELIAAAFAGVHLFDAAFVRGDIDGDGRVGLVDALGVGNFLFLRGNRELRICFNAADADNDGEIDITDIVAILNAAFFENDIIPPPRACGFDLEAPWSPGNLGCFENGCSPAS